MAERFTSDLAFILFVLLIAALLGFLIGYLLRKGRKCPKCEEMENENNTLKGRITKLEGENEEFNLSLKKLKEENEQLNLDLKKKEEEYTALKLRSQDLIDESSAETLFDRVKAREVLGFRVTENDLKIIEGIGPKISGILNKRGFKTWKALSEADPEAIRGYLLEDGGPRYRIHNPDTWPGQAKLAHEGLWQELKAFQEKLTGGRLVP